MSKIERAWRSAGSHRRRILLFSLTALSGIAIAPRPAHAYDIVYTWVEDDNNYVSVTGDLVVSDAALKAGKIKKDDVLDFTFVIVAAHSTVTYTEAQLKNGTTFPISIDTITAIPTSPSGVLIAENADLSKVLNIDFDTNLTIPGAESWTSAAGSGDKSGVGHWVVTVPEPVSIALAGIAVVIGVACGLVRQGRPSPQRIRHHGNDR